MALDHNYWVASAGDMVVNNLGKFGMYLQVISPHPFCPVEAVWFVFDVMIPSVILEMIPAYV
jgi:hypothetical protein